MAALVTLRGPSQPTTYWARTSRSWSPDVIRTVTPSASSRRPATCQPVSSASPTASRSTSSTSGCGTCWPGSAARSEPTRSRPKQPLMRVISRPSRPVTNTASSDHDTASGARDRNVSASPHLRSSSIERAEVVFARGRSHDTVSRGSTTRQRTP
jgi:hypothetical protein